MTNNHTKKSNHPNFFIKIKNMFKKKSHPVKIKINYCAQTLKNQKKKKRKKKRGNVNAQEKKRKEMTTRQCCCLVKREERKKNAT